MSEELGRNEAWAVVDRNGLAALSLNLFKERADRYCKMVYADGARVARVTLIESAALAKVREALDLLLRWDACDHGNDDQWEIDELYHLMLNTAKEARALLEPPQ